MTLEEAKARIAELEAALRYVVEHEPHEGEPAACTWCDMGGSGRATKGDGHHDDIRHLCPVARASEVLTRTPAVALKREQLREKACSAVKDVYNDFVRSEVESNTRSIQIAWEAGSALEAHEKEKVST
jgi:hypothetical protein